MHQSFFEKWFLFNLINSFYFHNDFSLACFNIICFIPINFKDTIRIPRTGIFWIYFKLWKFKIQTKYQKLRSTIIEYYVGFSSKMITVWDHKIFIVNLSFSNINSVSMVKLRIKIRDMYTFNKENFILQSHLLIWHHDRLDYMVLFHRKNDR